MMRPHAIWRHHVAHLRRQWWQELAAGFGIAIGVALVFATQVANTSLTASAEQISDAITGNATLQLAARDQSGLPAQTLQRVRALPGVEHASAISEQRATLVHGGDSSAVDLIGVDASLIELVGSAASSVLLGGLVIEPGVLLPATVAEQLGVERAGGDVEILIRGRAHRVRVAGVLAEATIGPLGAAQVAAAYLPRAQELAGLDGRISRVLVQPRPGAGRVVEAGLQRISNGRATVASVDAEVAALEDALAPNDQVTALFAAISVMVGLLLAANAMAMTLGDRRRDLRLLGLAGYTGRDLAWIVLPQALALGAIASTAGILLGDVLSRVAAQEPPSYLSFAFAVSSGRVVPFSTVALAWLGGIAMTLIAASGPLWEVRRSRTVRIASDSHVEPGQNVSPVLRRRMALAAVAIVATTSALLLKAPAATIVALGGLALATLLVIPLVFSAVLALITRVAGGRRLRPLLLAAMLLRSTTLRSLTLAAVGAVAVFGSVAIESAHRDLQRGLEQNFADFLAPAGLWVTGGGDSNSLTTQTFAADPALEQRLRALPQVASVRRYHGGLLDVDGQRRWIIARPPTDRAIVPPTQLEAGDLAAATARLRRTGWIAVSRSIARDHDADVGDTIALPTPTGQTSFRVAAILTNLGWGPGAIVLNTTDYRRAWANADPAALEVDLRPGVTPAQGRTAVAAALHTPALRVQTRDERHAQFMMLAEQGLKRLTQISLLLLTAAALAMAAAMATAIWQRRRELARMERAGYSPRAQWAIVTLEAATVIAVACMVGVATGSYGHLLLGRWLEQSTGFPAPFEIPVAMIISTCAGLYLAALVIVAVVGYFATHDRRPRRGASRRGAADAGPPSAAPGAARTRP